MSGMICTCAACQESAENAGGPLCLRYAGREDRRSPRRRSWMRTSARSEESNARPIATFRTANRFVRVAASRSRGPILAAEPSPLFFRVGIVRAENPSLKVTPPPARPLHVDVRHAPPDVAPPPPLGRRRGRLPARRRNCAGPCRPYGGFERLVDHAPPPLSCGDRCSNAGSRGRRRPRPSHARPATSGPAGPVDDGDGLPAGGRPRVEPRQAGPDGSRPRRRRGAGPVHEPAPNLARGPARRSGGGVQCLDGRGSGVVGPFRGFPFPINRTVVLLKVFNV